MSSHISIPASHSNSSVSNTNTDYNRNKLGARDKTDVSSISSNSGNVLPAATSEKKDTLLSHSDSEKSPNSQQLADMVKMIEDNIQHTRREIKFEVREELGTPIVSVLDQETKEVIRQFPAEEVVAMAERVAELSSEGKLFRTVV